MIDPGENFVQSVISELGEPPAFEPTAYYDPAGDTVEFLFANEPFFAKRLDGWVTVYYSEKTRDIVGGLIKGIRHNLLKRFPGLRIEIKGHKADIACLLRVPAWETGDEVKLQTYRAVIDKAEQSGTTADLQPA